MMTLRSLGAAALIPVLLAIGGCSAAGSSEPASSTVEGAGGRAPGYTAEDGAVPEAKPAGVPTAGQQQIARTAGVRIAVKDVEAAVTRLRQLATSMGGVITSENLVTSVDADGLSTPMSTMVISVTSDKLDSTLEQLKSIGTITSRVISSDDVTTQVADVASRIKTLDGSIQRLGELSKKAGTISELTQLESELTNRIAERDSLIAQQKVLAGMVAQSPITITLETPPKAGELETTGFMGGLIAGWNALVSSSRVLLTIVGAVLPFLAVVAVVGVPLVLWRRRTRSRATVVAEATKPADKE